MRYDSETAADLTGYVKILKKHIEKTRVGLRLLENKELVNLDVIEGQIKSIRECCKAACQENISGLCDQMMERISSARKKGYLNLKEEIPVLRAACNYMRLHADSLSRGVIPPRISVTLKKPARIDKERINGAAFVAGSMVKDVSRIRENVSI